MKLKLIQHNYHSICSAYIFEDFLDDLSYLDSLSNKIKLLTAHDEMNHKTNVKANMTSYAKLLEDNSFNFLYQKIMETIAICYRLRTAHHQEKFKLNIIDSWGMCHKENEETVLHDHGVVTWSAAFYLQVPQKTNFNIVDFNSYVELKSNMLVFFPGIVKHFVSPFTGEGCRISMACNIQQTNGS